MIPSWLVIGVITFAVPLTLNRFISGRDFRWFKRLRRPDWLTFEWAIPIIWTVIFIFYCFLAFSSLSTFPGVAIAVALVPPLSVVSIGLSLGQQEIVTGSFLLFITNLICIIFFGGLVFLFQSYGNIARAKKGLALSTVAMFLLGVPLTLSMRQVIIKKNVTSQISNLIVSETATFADADINLITVIPQQDYLQIALEVAAPIDSITQDDITRLRKILSQKINRPIDLRVEVIPMRVLTSPRD